jgi:O-succinylbenzoate synthase
MNLSAINLHWVRIPMHEPFRISSGEVSERDAILVETVAGGKTGWGEAAPMPAAFYSPETPEGTWEFLSKKLVPDFLSRPQLDPTLCFERLADFPGESFAKAGLEGAVWDLQAQLADRPLWMMLGGARRAIPSGAAIGLFPTVEELLDRVERFLGEHYRRIKIKIEPGHDVQIVRAIRKRFGDIPLTVDANASYHLAEAEVFRQLDEFGLMMIEQPLAREALTEHAELQRRIRTPICLDESADSLEAVREIIALGSGKIINIKVQRMGGLWPSRLAHDLAQAAGLACWLGTMPELGIASVQGLHLATLPNFTLPTDVEASRRWYTDDIIAPLIEVSSNGCIELPQGAGMGCRVDHEKVARYRIRKEEFRP